jgi:hypothetical protein
MSSTASSKSLDSAVVLSFSLVSALFISLIPLITTFYKDSLTPGLIYLILFVILPIVTYGITSMFNVFIQMIRCGKINANQVLMNGFPSVGLVGFLGGLAQLFGFMRYPVISILPDSFSDEVKKGIAVSFYVFWGAVYGQALGGSLSQSCATTA